MRNRRAFTLIEILVVLAIVGVLAIVIVFSVQGAQKKARNAKRTQDVVELAKAVNLYYVNTGKFPYNPTSGKSCRIGQTVIDDNKQTAICFEDVLKAGYLSTEIPLGPKKNEYYRYYNYPFATHTYAPTNTSLTVPGHVTIFATTEPKSYGPFKYGWNCSAEPGAGYWDKMDGGPGNPDKQYCAGFVY